MATEYNPTMCEFCQVKADCERLRTSVNCSVCPASLACASDAESERFFGTPICIEKHKEWMASPNTCTLTSGLLGSLETDSISQAFVSSPDEMPKEGEEAKPEEVPIKPPEGGSFSTALRVKCPRCTTNCGRVMVTYDWDIEAAMLSPMGNGGAVHLKAKYDCFFCRLSLEHNY